MQDMQDQAVGWYRDPAQPRLHRFWNGHTWVGPETSQNQVPRQVTPRRSDDQSAPGLGLSTVGFRSSETDS